MPDTILIDRVNYSSIKEDYDKDKGDGYTIRIRNTSVICGINYVSIEIKNQQGENEGFCVPISRISEQIFKSCKMSTT